MISPLLFLLAQSATPFGLPVDPILRPSEQREERSAEKVVDAKADSASPSSKPRNPVEARFYQCIDTAIDDPARGVAEANSWLIEGGGFLARHCLGFAQSEQNNWPAATTAFAEAAREAEVAQDERVAQFWAQAGNAALAGGQFDKALEYLNAALVQGRLEGLAKGLVHLDRARAHVALENYDAARLEFAAVHELAPEDPLGWLLSATLARRMSNLELAKKHIGEADQRAPGDPAIALEAGNIAFEAGDRVNAKDNWEKAIEIAADSAPAKVAQKYLDQLVTKVDE